MKRTTKLCYGIFLVGLLSLQVTATIFNRNFWPISSFNVFSGASGGDVWILKAILVDETGEETAVDPGRTLPVEFFKARSIYQRVFVSGTAQQKEEFATRLLARLHVKGWYGFDETLPSADSFKAVRLRVEAWLLDPTQLNADTGFEVKNRLLLYAGPS